MNIRQRGDNKWIEFLGLWFDLIWFDFPLDAHMTGAQFLAYEIFLVFRKLPRWQLQVLYKVQPHSEWHFVRLFPILSVEKNKDANLCDIFCLAWGQVPFTFRSAIQGWIRNCDIHMQRRRIVALLCPIQKNQQKWTQFSR